MSISAAIEPLMPAAVPPEPVCRLTPSQYHEMIAGGILAEGDPIELLEGWLVPKMVKNPPHSTARLLTTKVLERILPSSWHVRAQEPITLTDSEPEPDLAVVRRTPEHYAHSHPGPEDVALVVEVADASLARDQSIKKRIYARAGIPIYWVLNLPDRRLEVYSDPSGPCDSPDYRQHADYALSAEVPLMLDGRLAGRIAVAELLPAIG
jgi:hypothetical protein